MMFAKRLRPAIIAGEITSSVRIWRSPRVTVGGRYRLDGGHIKITGLREISFAEITPALARETGFAGVVDLLKVARHGTGERVVLVSFEYWAAAQ